MAVVNANYCKRGRGERRLAKGNISYIQTRPGRDKERLTRTLFGAAGTMGRREANQFITDAPKGTYFYRLKLSPDPLLEDQRRDLHMQKLTRAMMKRLEKRLKTAIPWAASLHDDHTDIRHVHILAAIPKRLRQHDLEFLIREATQACLTQRRKLDLSTLRQERGESKLPWQEHRAAKPLKTGKYTMLSVNKREYSTLLSPQRPGGMMPLRSQSSCTCPRCHMPQSHNEHRGSHLCASCGLMLHKQKARILQQSRGRELERAL